MSTGISDEASLDIVRFAATFATERALKPLCILVLGPDMVVRAALSQAGATPLRFDVARGKAAGALQMGVNSRELEQLAANRPAFFASLTALARGAMVPAAGGVLARDGEGRVIGAVGISGDTSDNDEACALHALRQVGLTPR